VRFKIGVIYGDGIGPEIVSAALQVLEATGLDLEFVELGAGYEYFKKTGKPFEDDIIDKVRRLDAVLKGPLYTPPGPSGYRSINVLLRQALDLYINLRPFRSFRGISEKNFNVALVRENTEDVYVGIEWRFRGSAFTLRIITEFGSKRVVEYAFRYALERGFNRVTVVHKANILKETDGLFREVFFEVAKKYPNVVADEVLVDTAAYKLIKNPGEFGVIVTTNLYGDILSDLLAGLVGSLGLCASAQIGDGAAVFEPVHGVAFDIAGKGVANPSGEILAAAYMLQYLGSTRSDRRTLEIGKIIEESVAEVVKERLALTPDLGGRSSTSGFASAVIKTLLEKLSSTH